mmetsp:Transcript_20541/g.55292  ORF Transcript_20541/g.55292 Transcript_20541/m.55292 type:complete len:466 (+) Transcript_20541:53-1450(+)
MLAARTASRTSRVLGARALSVKSLKETLAEQIPKKQAQWKQMKTDHGHKLIDTVTLDQCLGGARSVKCMVWETSLLDAQEGIRFRGYTIPELQEKLPTFSGIVADEPMPEGLLWLLLTGEIPSKAQVDLVTADLASRAKLPAHVEPLIRSFPKDMHSMTQLSIAVLALQTESIFAKKYHEGAPKSQYWEFVYEDSMNLLARLPEVAALIYRCKFHDGKLGATDPALDYSANFNRMLGFDNKSFDELMRLYISIHSDHEGGNASAHATHLVGSTLSDPYLSLSGGLNALAGPLHGLANQEVLGWIIDLQQTFKSRGLDVNKDTIKDFAWETLKSGKVIPGYGHAVLRKTDPRYTCQREFALKHLPDDELFKIVETIYQVVPDVLLEHGKTKNPFPNVDSHSGVLLQHYGFTEHEYYTVLFGVGRAFGVLSQLFWDRALGLPLERPKSVTPEWIMDFYQKNPDGLKP